MTISQLTCSAKSYPFSPPFARIVTPRFLPFMNGGGGHITAGGAYVTVRTTIY